MEREVAIIFKRIFIVIRRGQEEKEEKGKEGKEEIKREEEKQEWNAATPFVSEVNFRFRQQ